MKTPSTSLQTWQAATPEMPSMPSNWASSLPPVAKTVSSTSPLDVASQCIQKRVVRYDKNGDNHYDIISAFIKSMRGSDPDAAVYYLAKMLYAGEDVKFIARRIMILASEDIGNADPQALCVAVAAAQAVERVGMPESQIILSQQSPTWPAPPKATPQSTPSSLPWTQSNAQKPQSRHTSRTPTTAATKNWATASATNTPTTTQTTTYTNNTSPPKSRENTSTNSQKWATRKP